MDPKKIIRIRKAVERCRRPSGRIRYTAPIRTLARKLLAGGISPAELSNATGIGRMTILKWQNDYPRKKFRKLKVTTTDSSQQVLSGMRIEFPCGAFIECPSIAALQGLLGLAK